MGLSKGQLSSGEAERTTRFYPRRQPFFNRSYMGGLDGEGKRQAVASTPPPGVVLFAAVIEKAETVYGEEAVKLAAAEVCRRFDLFLN